MKITIHTDGGARGNPGPAAVGVVIEFTQHGKQQCVEVGKTIGEATNNVAEYRAVVVAMETLKTVLEQEKLQGAEALVQFYLDSNLVVNQLNGLFKIKEPTLRELLVRVRSLEGELGISPSYMYIPRERNTRADFLVNKALDENKFF